MVDSQPFCTNRMREEYPIEKAHDASDHSGKGKDDGSGDQRVFFERRHKK